MKAFSLDQILLWTEAGSGCFELLFVPHVVKVKGGRRGQGLLVSPPWWGWTAAGSVFLFFHSVNWTDQHPKYQPSPTKWEARVNWRSKQTQSEMEPLPDSCSLQRIPGEPRRSRRRRTRAVVLRWWRCRGFQPDFSDSHGAFRQSKIWRRLQQLLEGLSTRFGAVGAWLSCCNQSPII